MPLDPQARAVADLLGAALDITKLDLAEVRRMTDEAARQGPRPAVASVADRRIPGPAGELPVRIYRPELQAPAPAVVYFHGGGWTLCSIETHDATCRQLANGADCVVVSVDYRLAPEHVFPAAADDCYAALEWTVRNADALGVDPGRIGVAGDSAGGNLAAVVALMARDRGGPTLRHQLLVYPVADGALDTPSYTENAEGPVLTREMMEVFWDYYVPDPAERANPYASPLRAGDLSGLPRAFVVTAQYDPLRDEGEAYAARLRQAGVDAAHARYDGMMHGFFGMGDAIDRARDAMDDAVRELREALSLRG